MKNVIGTGFVTFTDLSDPVISSTAPPEPVEDMLWMDISTTPPVLKIYKNGEWVSVSDVSGSLPDSAPVGGYLKGGLNINRNWEGVNIPGLIQVQGGMFIHPNSTKYKIADSAHIDTGLSSNKGVQRYIMFIGSDTSRFDTSIKPNLSKSYVAASYEDKVWRYYIGNNAGIAFEVNDNDCIIAKVEEFQTTQQKEGIGRIIRYYEDEDSVFEALTGGGEIQGIYKKDGLLFINAEFIATGKLVSTNGVTELDLDKGTFRLGAENSNGNHIRWDGRKLSIKADELSFQSGSVASSDDLENAVEGIQIGGTNLIPNSAPRSLGWTSSQVDIMLTTIEDYNLAPKGKIMTASFTEDSEEQLGLKVYPKEPLAMGEKYTWSIWIKGNASLHMTVGASQGGTKDVYLGTEWRKFTHTFVAQESVDTAFAMMLNNIKTDNSFSVHSVKLERGTKVTDYSEGLDDVSNEIRDTEQSLAGNMDNAISNVQQEILESVSQTYATTDSLSAVSEEVQSNFNQTNANIEASFDSVKKYTEEVDGKINEFETRVTNYIRFTTEGMELGQSDSPFVAKLTNQRLSFLQDGVEVAYISDNKMHITEAEVKNSLRIGGTNKESGMFTWVQGETGNMSLKWSDK